MTTPDWLITIPPPLPHLGRAVFYLCATRYQWNVSTSYFNTPFNPSSAVYRLNHRCTFENEKFQTQAPLRGPSFTAPPLESPCRRKGLDKHWSSSFQCKWCEESVSCATLSVVRRVAQCFPSPELRCCHINISPSPLLSCVVSWKVLPGILKKHCCILPDRNTGKGQTDVPLSSQHISCSHKCGA